MSEFDQFFDDLDAQDNAVETTYPDAPEFEGKRGVTARKMYDAINARRDEILEALKRGETLRGRDRKIIRTSIAQSVGKASAYFNGRDFPELQRYLEDVNDSLERISFKPESFRSKRQASRDELKRRVAELESELDKNYAASLVDLAVVKQLGVVRQKQIQDGAEIDALSDKLKEARSNYNAAIEQIQELMDENTQLKQQIRDLGGEVKSTRTVRRVK